MSKPVFFDEKGTRSKRVNFWAASLLLILAVVTTTVLVSLTVVPLLPKIKGLNETIRRPKSLIPGLPSIDKRRSTFLETKAKLTLEKEIKADAKRFAAAMKNAQKPPPGSPIVAAFYSPEEEFGIGSFRDNAAKLTHVMPVWLALDRNDPARPDLQNFNVKPMEVGLTAAGQQLIEIARANGVHIWPVLTNLYGDTYDKQVVTALLDSPDKQATLAYAVRDWLLTNGFEGLNVDFESLDPKDYARLPDFLAVLQKTLREPGARASNQALGLSIDVEAEDSPAVIEALAKNADLVIAMVYDEHSQDGAAGPIADVNWVEDQLDKFATAVPANKLVAGIGNYAYDWTKGKAGAESLTFQGALKTAEAYRDGESPEQVLDFDIDSWNTHFTYSDEGNIPHDVWMLDGASAFNEWKLAHDNGFRGSALWELGYEDPSIWRFLSKGSIAQKPDPSALAIVQFGPDDLETAGNGDVLYAKGEKRDATRGIDVDAETGLIGNEVYNGYPSSYYLQKAGFAGPKTLSLTFDDGPDPANTPTILDILRELRVRATFFVIGQNAENNSSLIRRIYDEGHELGSHTFTHPNLDDVTDRRTELELNATQRAIEGIIGRTTALFRPPYNADSEPSKPEDVRPILLASQMGYVTVGESIDPQDWRLHQNADDTGALRAPQDIVDSVLYQLSQPNHGNVILLHDGGGDRSATVAALRILIPALRARGYSFVPVSALLGVRREEVMPPLSAKDRSLVGLDQFAFTAVFSVEWFLRLAFLVAIALGLLRVAMITPLAMIHRRRVVKASSATGQPSVSVLIAAFNEEKVIERTIASVLASDYSLTEIVVVDDGSSDGTYLEVITKFAGDSRIVALKQENGGKASALNRALGHARGEVVVCVDADTQLKPDAVGLLVRHFVDREIGAVAGNVKVGNRINLLTRWQSIEYITSQNLDRRAYALLNSVSVCPGAIGAWRKSAVTEAGGYLSDTLAEDMDLTWRLRRGGWKIDTESEAIAYTEAPDTFGGFFRQRFRWAYGTLQCLWKHKRALGHNGWFGWLTMPSLWLFQIAFQVLAPLVDLLLLYTAILFLIAWISKSDFTGDWRPAADVQQTLISVAFLYGLFFTVELIAGFVAFRMDRERTRSLWWMFLQRFVYRQIMYAVVIKSVAAAFRGMRQGWGKLERKATVDAG